MFERRAGVDGDTEVVQDCAGLLVQFRPVDDPPAAHGLASEEDVLRHAQGSGQAALLEDHGHAGLLGGPGIVKMHLPAGHANGAFVGSEHARQDVHQGALAGAVLAEQGVDFAVAHVEIDPAEGPHAGEGLGDAPRLQQRIRRHRSRTAPVYRPFDPRPIGPIRAHSCT